MPEDIDITIEILKLIASCLTPIIILVLGFLINKSIERNKKNILQEKEWQVRWAETFLIRAIKFNENISVIVTTLFKMAINSQNENISEGKKMETEEKLLKIYYESIENCHYLDWDIQNFAQFAKKNGENVIEKQKELIGAIRKLIDDKQEFDIEKIRRIQFEYNKLVRKAHHEILNAVDNIK